MYKLYKHTKELLFESEDFSQVLFELFLLYDDDSDDRYLITDGFKLYVLTPFKPKIRKESVEDV